jgi:hypothetical protein
MGIEKQEVKYKVCKPGRTFKTTRTFIEADIIEQYSYVFHAKN